MDKNYYEILGISDEEKKLKGDDFQKIVKKKYRSLAAKWHPDKFSNESEEKQKEAEENFKNINKANEVLSDDKKRQNYDMFGDENAKGFGHSSMNDMFKDFFNMSHQRVVKGSPLRIVVSVSIDDIINGSSKKIKYKRKVPCEYCFGEGGEFDMCQHCGGTGYITKSRQNSFMFSQIQEQCPHCHGMGKTLKKRCDKCGGSGLHTKEEIIDIEIPKGNVDGMSIVYREQGSFPQNTNSKNAVAGDLYIVFKIEENKQFKFEGNNVIYTLPIHYCDAILGCQKEIPTITGSNVKIEVKPLTQNNTSLRLKGKGLCDVSNNSIIGDMYVVINYQLPKVLTDKHKELLSELKNLDNKE